MIDYAGRQTIMRVGVKFPSREIGSDTGVIREWTAVASGLGFAHIVVIDAVLGIDPAAHPDGHRHSPDQTTARPRFTIDHPFHEPLVLLGFLAGLAPDLGLTTGVLVSPQRQTAVVAKQAAEVDILCGGRLRLGLGLGWNPIEFEALGGDFQTRGRRAEEQIGLLRALWTQKTVDHDGEFDRIVGVGIAPRPIQRPIPIWMGGYADAALRRIGRLADGWYVGPNLAGLPRSLEIVRAAAAGAGRSPDALPFEGHAGIGYGEALDTLPDVVELWRAAGAAYLTIDTMGAGYQGAEHAKILPELASRIAALTETE
jgi:probable F420-dependent oxidoreductase